ncbi:hypothetical protein BN159_3123 [Streptomyces davaonensis JCM 4913]|uniref:Uncharacterized protein n=1 Tax=Streptomyces davaonensis (strain DSM 101723 / JCM 4913 / KCC S-0913 / 768) TaxID=1214101 RepID=K4R2Z5_STRDJ|nr:hypothetical protein [Streptomyces davaonensis]CCK27502.1 hypothetical protein BN159_3123 [Streptomyces davaonensis JCM 4913]
MDSEEHACPVCGQSVETVVRRHKTLGAWVPRWVAGPCRNPQCEAFVVPGTEEEPQEHHHHHRRRPHHEPQQQPERREEPEEPAASGP